MCRLEGECSRKAVKRQLTENIWFEQDLKMDGWMQVWAFNVICEMWFFNRSFWIILLLII